MDFYSKAVLSVIAACLLLLVARGFEMGGGASGATALDSPQAGGVERYKLIFVPRTRLFLRLDTQTGETWRATWPESTVWIPLVEVSGEAPYASEEEGGPEAPDAAPEPWSQSGESEQKSPAARSE